MQNENRKAISAIFEHGFTDRLKFSATARYMHRMTFWDRWMFAGDFLDEDLDGDGNPIAGTGTTIGRFYYGPYNETFKLFLADSRLSWKADTGPLRHNLLGGIDYRRTNSRTKATEISIRHISRSTSMTPTIRSLWSRPRRPMPGTTRAASSASTFRTTSKSATG